MITTQQPITSCCYFHNHCTVEKLRRENSKGICCAFVIPLAQKKTSFHHCNVYLESWVCFFLQCFLILLLSLPSFIEPITLNAEKLHKPYYSFIYLDLFLKHKTFPEYTNATYHLA